MHLPTIAAIRAFECVARHENFSRAAEELNLTQGAISYQIITLEKLLGITLFQRVRHRVVITPAGRNFLSGTRDILLKLQEVTGRAMSSGEAASLNLGGVPTFMGRWIVPRLPSFIEKHPNIQINFVSENIRFDFEEHDYDAAFHYGDPDWQHTHSHHLFDEMMLPVCSVAFREKWNIASEEDLARVPLIQQFSRPMAWAEWFEHVGVERRSPLQGVRFQNFSITLEAVKAGIGAALLPYYLVEKDRAQKGIVILSSQVLPRMKGYYFVYPQKNISVPEVVAFRDWILRRAAEYKNIAIER